MCRAQAAGKHSPAIGRGERQANQPDSDPRRGDEVEPRVDRPPPVDPRLAPPAGDIGRVEQRASAGVDSWVELGRRDDTMAKREAEAVERVAAGRPISGQVERHHRAEPGQRPPQDAALGGVEEQPGDCRRAAKEQAGVAGFDCARRKRSRSKREPRRLARDAGSPRARPRAEGRARWCRPSAAMPPGSRPGSPRAARRRHSRWRGRTICGRARPSARCTPAMPPAARGRRSTGFRRPGRRTRQSGRSPATASPSATGAGTGGRSRSSSARR